MKKTIAIVALCLAGGCVWAGQKIAPIVVPVKTSAGLDAGTATFVQKSHGVEVKLKLKNIPAGFHGVHIHEVGKCEPTDFKTAGGHFNPTGKQHGWENPSGHHAGDFPANLEFTMSHELDQSFTLKDVSLDPSAANSLTGPHGSSIVIHEHRDDMKTDPSGLSGNRIACGVISPAQ
jgi:superoxide dismutase, Cu-Zn family